MYIQHNNDMYRTILSYARVYFAARWRNDLFHIDLKMAVELASRRWSNLKFEGDGCQSLPKPFSGAADRVCARASKERF